MITSPAGVAEVKHHHQQQQQEQPPLQRSGGEEQQQQQRELRQQPQPQPQGWQKVGNRAAAAAGVGCLKEPSCVVRAVARHQWRPGLLAHSQVRGVIV